MKKFIALFAALAICCCLFAACGDDETYRMPGNGTTSGSTAPELDDDNGSYNADRDGEVSLTTDDNGILEDGIDDVEDGIDRGMNDLEQGIDDLEQGMDDMTDGSEADPDAGANGEGMQPDGMNGQNDGAANGSTNGNSR